MFQVDVSAASLNSNDAFLLKMADGRGYLWMGKGASEEEEKGAEHMSKELNCSSKCIMEGNEPGHLLHLTCIYKTYMLYYIYLYITQILSYCYMN